MPTIRFDRVRRLSSPDRDATGFATRTCSTAPSPGQVINIAGYPYVVLCDIGWAYGDDDEPGEYCYVRIVPAFDEWRLRGWEPRARDPVTLPEDEE